MTYNEDLKRFKDKSHRLQSWDYGGNGKYFVTIDTYNKIHYFGEISGGKIQYSQIGQNAKKCWREIPVHFPFVQLDEWEVMPNHVHGIIIIDKSDENISPLPPDHDLKNEHAGTQNFASLPSDFQTNYPKNRFGPQSGNLASVIRGFKTGVTKFATMNHIEFKWQSRFYDKIIWNPEQLWMYRIYIQNNIRNWGK